MDGVTEEIITFGVLDRSGAQRVQGASEDAARDWIARHLEDVMLRAGAPFTLQRVTVTMTRVTEPVETFDVEDDA